MGLCVSKSSQMDSECTLCLQDFSFADDKGCRLLDLSEGKTSEKNCIYVSEVEMRKSKRSFSVEFFPYKHVCNQNGKPSSQNAHNC